MNNYEVTFKDNSIMQFEALTFNRLADILEVYCLCSGKEVKRIELIEEKE